jgi:hypothetical protein
MSRHLAAELLESAVADIRPHELRPQVPALEHRDARPGIADGEPEVEIALLGVDHRLAALRADPVAVGEHDLLNGVVEARMDQQGAALLLQGQLGSRAERLDERTPEKVAMASASVPAAVASDEIVAQSATGDPLSGLRRPTGEAGFDCPSAPIPPRVVPGRRT